MMTSLNKKVNPTGEYFTPKKEKRLVQSLPSPKKQDSRVSMLMLPTEG